LNGILAVGIDFTGRINTGEGPIDLGGVDFLGRGAAIWGALFDIIVFLGEYKMSIYIYSQLIIESIEKLSIK